MELLHLELKPSWGVSAHFYISATGNLNQEEDHEFQVNLDYMGSLPKNKQREKKTWH